MGKLKITCEFDGSEKALMTYDVEQCSENNIANALREIFLTAYKNELVRPGILLPVLDDIITEMMKSELGANCTENTFANILREIIVHAHERNFIRKEVLLSVLKDVINEIS